jgi:hypothetical protein
VKLNPALVVGETSHGTRRIIPITGGNFEGPKMKGEILDGGADWQIIRKDGGSELEAHNQNRRWSGDLNQKCSYRKKKIVFENFNLTGYLRSERPRLTESKYSSQTGSPRPLNQKYCFMKCPTN